MSEAAAAAGGNGAGDGTGEAGEYRTLATALSAEEEGLLTCVHCGFCLPVCPTYTRLGDENDSPRGRLYLMRAVVEGRLEPSSEAFRTHIDRCLGCRACEPVCPSGVPYGNLLELARHEAARARSPGLLTRLLLAIFGAERATRVFTALGGALRATGLPSVAARLLPDGFGLGPVRLGLGMLAASRPWAGLREVPGSVASGGEDRTGGGEVPTGRTRVALLTGCVQEGLFARVNRATRRVLEANGFEVEEVGSQSCCGALHAHGGDLETARSLARQNVEAFGGAGAEVIAVNAAGCGAAMKEYGHLLAGDSVAPESAALAERVRDVSELLARAGPGRGGPLELTVAVDEPCHLLHAQRVSEAPRRVLEAIPGLEVVPLERAEECCGGAGIYGITHPELGGRVTADKIDAVERSGARVVATANPGCIMQIGAGLLARGSDVRAVHPLELLDESYRRAGYYS